MQGVRYHSQNARDLLPRVLLLLTFENETGVVGKALDRAPEVLDDHPKIPTLQIESVGCQAQLQASAHPTPQPRSML